MATFGERFKTIRQAKGLTQEVVARRLGYKRPAPVSFIETSANLPRPKTILRYAAALTCEPWELLEDVLDPYAELRAGRMGPMVEALPVTLRDLPWSAVTGADAVAAIRRAVLRLVPRAETPGSRLRRRPGPREKARRIAGKRRIGST